MSLQREQLLPVTTAGLLLETRLALFSEKSCVAHSGRTDSLKNGSKSEKTCKAMPNMVSRSFFQPYSLTASKSVSKLETEDNSITFPKQSGSAGAVVDEVGEGAEIPLDVTSYSAVTVVPKKIAHGFVITRELIENCGAEQTTISPHKLTRSERSKEMWKNPEFRERHRQSMNKLRESPEYWDSVSKGLEKHWENNDERRKQHSERMKEAWKDPNSSRRKTMRSESYRKRMSIKRKEISSDPEYLENQSLVHKAWWNNLSEEEKTKVLERWTKKSKTFRKLTSIENKMFNGLILRNLGFGLIRQFMIFANNKYRSYFIDLCYPDVKVAIECLGDYWHANPKKYKTLDNIQEKCVANDKKKIAHLESIGYKILQFYETDIKKNLEDCLNIIECEILLSGYRPDLQLVTDSLIPVQQDQLVRASLRLANKVDKDCISAIGAGATSTAAANGKSLATNGTEFVLSGSTGPGIGMYDLLSLKRQYRRFNRCQGKRRSLQLHARHSSNPSIRKEIHRTPAALHSTIFLRRSKNADRIHRNARRFRRNSGLGCIRINQLSNGFSIRSLSGSHNEHPGSIYKAKNALVESPMGFFIERRPITTAIAKGSQNLPLTAKKPLEERDSMGVYISMRYGITVLKGETISAITGICTS